jgi:hypothetical protein
LGDGYKDIMRGMDRVRRSVTSVDGKPDGLGTGKVLNGVERFSSIFKLLSVRSEQKKSVPVYSLGPRPSQRLLDYLNSKESTDIDKKLKKKNKK